MAKKPKSEETKITRIKASDDAPATKPKRATKPTAAKSTKLPAGGKDPQEQRAKKPKASGLRAFGGYFKGSWQELRQVRWPDRRSTWAMTGALLAFTTFFVVVILLLDALFKYLFELLLGI